MHTICFDFTNTRHVVAGKFSAKLHGRLRCHILIQYGQCITILTFLIYVHTMFHLHPPESFNLYKEVEIPTGKEKYPVLRKYTKSQQRIKQSKISYPIASLVFRNFLCLTYRNSLNIGISRLDQSKYLKKCKFCKYEIFCSGIYILVAFMNKCGTSKVYLCLEDKSSSFPRVRLTKAVFFSLRKIYIFGGNKNLTSNS